MSSIRKRESIVLERRFGTTGRWTSLGWILLSIVVILVLVWPQLQGESRPTRPVTVERGYAGIAALATWAQRSGISVVSLRERYGSVASQVNQLTGNLLLVHVPFSTPPHRDEIDTLFAWIGAGNTLLLSAAMLETPPWRGAAFATQNALRNFIGFEWSVESQSAEKFDITKPIQTSSWVLVNGATSIASLVDSSAKPWFDEALDSSGREANSVIQVPWNGERWRLVKSDQDHSLELVPVLLHDDGSPDVQVALWESTYGSGRVLLLAHPSLLNNSVISRHANRQFAIQLVADALGPGGMIVFDDAHQGLNNIVDGDDVLRDPRLHGTIAFILLFWVAYLLANTGSWEMTLRRPQQERRSVSDLVHASGGYLHRMLSPSAAAYGLLEPLRNRLRDKWQLPPDRALEDGLALERHHAPEEVDAVVALIQQLQAGRKISIDALQNHLVSLRKAIN